MQTDAELVEAVLRGDRAAFALLVRRHERAVMATALGILQDHHAAQDVAQEALVSAYQQLGSLRDGARFGRWVLSIVGHRARRVARQRAKLPHVSVPLDSPLLGVTTVGGNGRSDELLEELFRAVSRLPERQRRIVLLRYFDGLSVREVAEATGRPVGTVTKYLSRAHRRLRELLKDTQK